MKPVSPVLKGFEEYEIVLAKDQPQYMPLPVVISEGEEVRMISRWEFSELEKEQIAEGGSLILEQLTFGNRYQPTALSILSKEKDPNEQVRIPPTQMLENFKATFNGIMDQETQ